MGGIICEPVHSTSGFSVFDEGGFLHCWIWILSANAISIFSSAKRSAVTVILCCCVHGPILFSLVYHLYNDGTYAPYSKIARCKHVFIVKSRGLEICVFLEKNKLYCAWMSWISSWEHSSQTDLSRFRSTSLS